MKLKVENKLLHKFRFSDDCLVRVIVFITLCFHANSGHALKPFASPAVPAGQHAPGNVLGELGGVPVTIPRHFANLVEYEGDPGWDKRKEDPKREYSSKSKLVSFGYYTRFPDMAGLSSPDMIADRARYSASTTPWIGVGIISGKHFPGERFLDLQVAAIGKSADILKYENYEQLTIVQYGLKGYAAKGIDSQTGKPYREHRFAHDLFVHTNETGNVDAYIDCSNRRVPAPPCKHTFSLAPLMKVEVYVTYRRSQLMHWKEIQNSVSQQILGFRSKIPSASHKP